VWALRRKPKIINKNNRVSVLYCTEKGEQLSARETDALSRDLVPGLFPVEITPRGKKTILTFDVTGYIALPSYLKSGLRKQHFAALLADVFYLLKDFQERFFSVSAVLLDHDFVFIDPATKKARFIFIPVQLFTGGTSIREFYMGFVKNTVFSQHENLDYKDELEKILKRGINVSLFDLEEYIISITDNLL